MTYSRPSAVKPPRPLNAVSAAGTTAAGAGDAGRRGTIAFDAGSATGERLRGVVGGSALL